LKEEEYLQKHFSEINANLPFQRNDTILSIASKIAALEKESIDDTLSLITHDDLQQGHPDHPEVFLYQSFCSQQQPC
jgi:hypothetical protein